MSENTSHFTEEAVEKLEDLKKEFEHPFTGEDDSMEAIYLFIIGALARKLAYDAKVEKAGKGARVAPLIDVAEDDRIEDHLKGYVEFTNAVFKSLGITRRVSAKPVRSI